MVVYFIDQRRDVKCFKRHNKVMQMLYSSNKFRNEKQTISSILNTDKNSTKRNLFVVKVVIVLLLFPTF